MYKYYAYKNSEQFYGNVLTDESIIPTLLSSFPMHEHHSSIIRYDRSGTPLSCPIVIDVDCEGNVDMALSITRDIVKRLVCVWCIKPITFFSGYKGFHILVPYNVISNRCNDVVREMLRPHLLEYGKSIDWQLYRARGLLRLNGSLNLKSGLYKSVVDVNMSLDEIRNLSSVKQQMVSVSYLTSNELVREQMSVVLPAPASMASTTKQIDFNDMLPCIRKIWADGVGVGSRHNAILILAIHMKKSGMSIDETMDALESHEYYGSIVGSHRSVVRGVYGKNYGISCNSSIGMFLKDYCSGLCPYDVTYEDIVRL